MRVSSLENRKSLGASYLRRSVCSTGLPVILTIESTSLCNLKCIMCPYPSMGRKNEHMSMTVFERIVEEGAGFVEFMWLHLFGEPLLNPNIYKMIDMAESAGIRTGMSTNATRLDEKASAALLESKLSLLILCLDGATKETFEGIRVGAKFEKVHSNIARFAELKCASNSALKTTLQMIHMTDNEREREMFEQEWRDKGFDEILYKPFNFWANQDQNLIHIQEKSSPTPATGACTEPWIGVTVLADGIVVPCCNDYSGKMPLGDLKTQTLREVWNGPKMMELRRRFAGDRPDLAGTICEQCPYHVAAPQHAENGTGAFSSADARLDQYLKNIKPMSKLNPQDPHLVDLTVKAPQTALHTGQSFACEVKVLNRSPWTLCSTGDMPVHISYHWFAADGSIAVYEGMRTRLVPELPQGKERTYIAQFTAPPRSGQFSLQVSLVQERVAWFESWSTQNADVSRVQIVPAVASLNALAGCR